MSAQAAQPAFFAERGEGDLWPQPIASSGWGRGQLRGMAVSGALARAVERCVNKSGRAELVPARWHADLYRPVGAEDSVSVKATVVREGRRMLLVDAVMMQNGREVSRGSGLFLAPGVSPSGAVWTPRIQVDPPPVGLRPDGEEPRLFFSEGVGWSARPDGHRVPRRKQTWHLPLDVVVGEKASPFQAAASAADVVSVVSNWGENGLEFINADLSVAFSRMPISQELGIAAVDRLVHAGIVAGSAHLYDRDGAFGLATVSAMASQQQVRSDRRRLI